MIRILLLAVVPFLIFGAGMAYAEPLDDVQTTVIDYDGNHATVQLNWNYDVMAEKYEIGCVSCIPNVAHFSTENSFIMENISASTSNLNVLLYIIAYDSDGEIIHAKQILVDLKV